ncbi:hypothetical protein ACODUO_15055 [Stenotrophomonas maltophilia]
MSAPVDVLAVLARAFGAANEHYDDLRIEANEAPLGPAWERAGRYMREHSEARAAVAELIEALTLARSELYGLPHSLGYRITHLPRIDAALARVKGGAA